jgi:hypothetical protein
VLIWAQIATFGHFLPPTSQSDVKGDVAVYCIHTQLAHLLLYIRINYFRCNFTKKIIIIT